MAHNLPKRLHKFAADNQSNIIPQKEAGNGSNIGIPDNAGRSPTPSSGRPTPIPDHPYIRLPGETPKAPSVSEELTEPPLSDMRLGERKVGEFQGDLAEEKFKEDAPSRIENITKLVEEIESQDPNLNPMEMLNASKSLDTKIKSCIEQFEWDCLHFCIADYNPEIEKLQKRVQSRLTVIKAEYEKFLQTKEVSQQNNSQAQTCQLFESLLMKAEEICNTDFTNEGINTSMKSLASLVADLIRRTKHMSSESSNTTSEIELLITTAMKKLCTQYEVIDKEVVSLRKNVKENSELIKMLARKIIAERHANDLPKEPPAVTRAARPSVILLPTIDDKLEEVNRERSQQSPQFLQTPSQCSPTSLNNGSQYINDDLVQYQSGKIQELCHRVANFLENHDVSKTNEVPNKLIKEYYDMKLKPLSKDVSKLDSAAEEFLKKGHKNPSLIQRVQLLTAKANNWISKVTEDYIARGLHLPHDGKQLLDTIPVFSGDGKVTIYEFLKLFDDATADSLGEKQRAAILYSKHLSKRLQADLYTRSNDLSAMISWLLEKFGQVRIIIEAKLNPIISEKLPDENSQTSISEYYRIIHLQIQEIANLHLTSNLSPAELFDYIHKVDFVQFRVLTHLPESFASMFIECMEREGLNFQTIDGKRSFELMLDLTGRLSRRSEQLSQIAMKKSKKGKVVEQQPKAKSFKTSVAAAKSESQNEARSSSSPSPTQKHVQSNQGTKTKTPEQEQQKAKTTKKSPVKKANVKQWYDQSLQFPCPIVDHLLLSHELGACEQFFKSDPIFRKAHCKGRLCFTCLGPRDKCQSFGNPKCKQMSKVPKQLICVDCKYPTNILLCTEKTHTRILLEDTLTGLESWVPKFKANAQTMRSHIQTSVNIINISHACICGVTSTNCSCEKPKSKTRPVNPSDEAPIFNVTTGELVEREHVQTIATASEDSIYLFQTLQVCGEEVLTFYDTGANADLISGNFAEKHKLKVLCSENMTLGTVGGERIWTNYGLYTFSIGPDMNGQYHEIVAQGIGTIMNKLPIYQLDQINAEVKMYDVKDSEPFPEYIGGEVKLLLGIKNSPLVPTLKFSLPGGLGVYESNMRDKWGSNIIYGGPHKLFTQMNSRNGSNFHHVQVMLTEITNSYRNSPYLGMKVSRCIDDERFLDPEVQDFECFPSLPVQKNCNSEFL